MTCGSNRNASPGTGRCLACGLPSEARKNLFPLIEQVNEDHSAVEITSRRGDAVLLSRAEYDALQETAYLLRVPANARHLLDSLEQARSGEATERGLSR